MNVFERSFGEHVMMCSGVVRVWNGSDECVCLQNP
jgi:hypothetical protein